MTVTTVLVLYFYVGIASNTAHCNENAVTEVTTSESTLSITTAHHISSHSLGYSLDEQLETGCFIADLRRDLRAIGNDVGQDSIFQFIDRKSFQIEYVDLDERSGLLKTSRFGQLDREMCGVHGTGTVRSWFHSIDPTSRSFECLPDEHGQYCRKCTLVFDVIVLPETIIVKVSIDVLDINDNTPAFSFGDVTSVGISESSEIGTEIIIGSITDADGTSAGNGIERCELQSSSAGTYNKMGIVLKRRLDDDVTVDLYLVLLGKLDRENDGSYLVVVVTAYDGGRPSRSSSATINITIIDVNDNTPQFRNISYEIAVREDIAVGTVLIHVEAIDMDSGLNGEIEYSLCDDCHYHDSGCIDSFSVDRRSGAVVVVDNLDYETHQQYLLTIVATDSGHEQLSGSVGVYINVVDVNDNVPSIRIDPSGHHTHQEYEQATKTIIELSESAPPGSFVAHLSVTDLDQGINGQFTCFVDVGSGRTHFTLNRIYDDEYVLVTVVGMDREQRSSYDVSVTCTDRGEQLHLVTTRAIFVEITDENDNSPTFPIDWLNLTVVENNEIGCWLKSVSATDLDVGLNADIVYRLEPAEINEMLMINDTTGILSAATMFSHNQMTELSFEVVATDRGKPARCGRLRVTLYVVEERMDDQNEGVLFLTSNYVFHVYENQPAGVAFGAVSAAAFDNGRIVMSSFQVGSFHFSITEDDTNFIFTKCCVIDRSTGRLMTTRKLDREQQPFFRFTVTASYRPLRPSAAMAGLGLPPVNHHCHLAKYLPHDDLAENYRVDMLSRSASATLTIHVNDVNDNSPRFVFPASDNNSLTVTVSKSLMNGPNGSIRVSYHEINHLLSTSPGLHAIDIDRGQNAVVVYSIVGGTGHRLFDVDYVTGQLSINTDVEMMLHETKATYSLVAEAADGGRPHLTSTATLIIIIDAVRPKFTALTIYELEDCAMTSGCRRSVTRFSIWLDLAFREPYEAFLQVISVSVFAFRLPLP